MGALNLLCIVNATHTSILWMLRLIFNMQSPLGYLYSSNQRGTVHQNQHYKFFFFNLALHNVSGLSLKSSRQISNLPVKMTSVVFLCWLLISSQLNSEEERGVPSLSPSALLVNFRTTCLRHRTCGYFEKVLILTLDCSLNFALKFISNWTSRK